MQIPFPYIFVTILIHQAYFSESIHVVFFLLVAAFVTLLQHVFFLKSSPMVTWVRMGLSLPDGENIIETTE